MKPIAAVLIFAVSGSASAIPIGGVEFPDGAVSFADAVVSYAPGPDVGPTYDIANAALGLPDWDGAGNGATSLGEGGTLVVQFTDNSLTTSGNADADLWIFEIGPQIEAFNVEISVDALNWIDLGTISGQPSGFDIDANASVVAGTQYSFVRLTDVLPNESLAPFGEADIDAIGAISSAPPVPMPMPGALALLGLGLVSFGVSRSR